MIDAFVGGQRGRRPRRDRRGRRDGWSDHARPGGARRRGRPTRRASSPSMPNGRRNRCRSPSSTPAPCSTGTRPRPALDILAPWKDGADTAVLALQCEALLAAGRNAEALRDAGICSPARRGQVHRAVGRDLQGRAGDERPRHRRIRAGPASPRTSPPGSRSPTCSPPGSSATAATPRPRSAISPCRWRMAARIWRCSGNSRTCLVTQRRLDDARDYLRGLEPANAGEKRREPAPAHGLAGDRAPEARRRSSDSSKVKTLRSSSNSVANFRIFAITSGARVVAADVKIHAVFRLHYVANKIIQEESPFAPIPRSSPSVRCGNGTEIAHQARGPSGNRCSSCRSFIGRTGLVTRSDLKKNCKGRSNKWFFEWGRPGLEDNFETLVFAAEIAGDDGEMSGPGANIQNTLPGHISQA